ncbi:hypothetical protein [Chitinophaga solisilvae]|uniref:hypothetical protein n=1 Tax=Chitinophaga solisilvae TaxID=1233460 RepID=UPI00137084F1|nr:hypothetical protein [Chitinophaga solisilvae]
MKELIRRILYLSGIPLLLFFIALAATRGNDLETIGIMTLMLAIAYGIVGVSMLIAEDRSAGLSLILSALIISVVAFITGWVIL